MSFDSNNFKPEDLKAPDTADESARKLFLDSQELSLSDSNILEIDGQFSTMTYGDAQAYCKKNGFRMPTARELAVWMNPNAIKEASEIDPDNPPKGYYRVACLNNGKEDVFYYNNEMKGSRVLTGKLKQYSFWTSSIALGATDFAHVFYGPLGGGGGEKYDHLRTALDGHAPAKHCLLLLPIKKSDHY